MHICLIKPLGYLIDKSDIEPLPHKIQVIENFPKQKTGQRTL